MGWLGIGSEVNAAGEGVKLALDSVGGLANSIRTAITGIDPAKQMEINKILVEAEDKIVSGQQALNMIAAQSSSFFHWGARPSILWICALGLSIHFIINPFFAWGLTLYNKEIVLPNIDIEGIYSLVIALLGLGGLRTVEKFSGVQGNH